MKVFISWSGDKSQNVALALRDWLPGVMNSVEPFVSAKDIYAGTRWQGEIAAQLDQSNFGIVCVTQENQSAPWLNFEAGALAKAVDVSRLIPLAVDLKPSDVEIPLGQFQAQPATKDGIRAVVVSLNDALGEDRLPPALLDKSFGVWWPNLEARLIDIEQETGTAKPPPRTERELLEETLDTVRALSRAVDRIQLGGGGRAGDDDILHKAAVDRIVEMVMSENVTSVGVTTESIGPVQVLRVGTEQPLPTRLKTQIRVAIAPYGYQVEFEQPRALASPSESEDPTEPS